MKKQIYKIFFGGMLLSIGIIYGMVAQRFQLFPYGILKETSARPIHSIPIEYYTIDDDYFKTNVNNLISIKNPQDIYRLRCELITYLWGEPRLPSALPLVVEKDVKDGRYIDISSLAKIDKLTVSMEFGIESYIYHFFPKHPNNKLILYHQGHDGDFYISKLQIKRLLDNGYSVIGLSMPLLGANNQPEVELARIGRLKLTGHDQMKFLIPRLGHPIKFLVEPTIITMNYIKKYFNYSIISMIGISGGGWTTTLAAAVDIRIQKSFPVAGSYPIYLRSGSTRDWGDYEQTTPEIYRIVNYLEMYILGSHGINRKQVQVINQYDECCFAGLKWKTYKDIVTNRVHELGDGEFDLFLDSTHKDHKVSNAALKLILEECSKPAF